VISAFSKAIDFKGQVTYRAPNDAFEEALLSELNFRSDKARGVLGWVPKQIPLAQGMKIYAGTYNAFN
jgi:hypothetical protein